MEEKERTEVIFDTTESTSVKGIRAFITKFIQLVPIQHKATQTSQRYFNNNPLFFLLHCQFTISQAPVLPLLLSFSMELIV